MGRLSTDESARFEEHFVDCAVCLDCLEATERFLAALKPLASEAAGAADVRAGQPAWPRAAWLVAAALVIAAGLSLLLTVRNVGIRRELDQARMASLNWQHRYEQEREASQARPAGPLMGSTFYLTISRGSDSDTADPVNRVTLSSDPRWVILSLEGELEPGFQIVRASLRDSEGKDVWQQSGLRAIPHEVLSVILPPGVLHGGNYALTVEGLSSDGRYHPAGRYRFRAATR